MIHVYPVDEEEQHLYEGYCYCGGKVHIESESGDMVYVHKSLNVMVDQLSDQDVQDILNDDTGGELPNWDIRDN